MNFFKKAYKGLVDEYVEPEDVVYDKSRFHRNRPEAV
jgi:hypothetical protein